MVLLIGLDSLSFLNVYQNLSRRVRLQWSYIAARKFVFMLFNNTTMLRILVFFWRYMGEDSDDYLIFELREPRCRAFFLITEMVASDKSINCMEYGLVRLSQSSNLLRVFHDCVRPFSQIPWVQKHIHLTFERRTKKMYFVHCARMKAKH